jgi:type II secretory pathway component PulM
MRLLRSARNDTLDDTPYAHVITRSLSDEAIPLNKIMSDEK